MTSAPPPPVFVGIGEDAGAREELGAPGGSLLVAFGGLLAPRGQDFEFDRLTQEMATHRVLLRDHERCWYHRGARGIGEDLASVEGYLRDVVGRAQPERVTFTGASAGGYAALLFGERLGVDVVHAFAPQTFVSLTEMRRRREPRWRAEARLLERTRPAQLPAADLRNVLGQPGVRTAQHVWYCADTELDVVQASNLREVDRVVLHCLAEGGHTMVKHLRDDGSLDPLLRRSLDGKELPARTDEVAPVFQDRGSLPHLAKRRARIVRSTLEHRLLGRPMVYH